MPSHANPVNWFEIPVDDLKRARTFYEAVLGIELIEQTTGPNAMAWFPMAQGATGAAGALIQGSGYVPSHDGSLVYIHVDEIDGTLARIDAAGGKRLLPRTSIGEHGFIAHFEDSEGNRVALHEAPAESS